MFLTLSPAPPGIKRWPTQSPLRPAHWRTGFPLHCRAIFNRSTSDTPTGQKQEYAKKGHSPPPPSSSVLVCFLYRQLPPVCPHTMPLLWHTMPCHSCGVARAYVSQPLGRSEEIHPHPVVARGFWRRGAVQICSVTLRTCVWAKAENADAKKRISGSIPLAQRIPQGRHLLGLWLSPGLPMHVPRVCIFPVLLGIQFGFLSTVPTPSPASLSCARTVGDPCPCCFPAPVPGRPRLCKVQGPRRSFTRPLFPHGHGDHSCLRRSYSNTA